ncbi:MAG: HAD family hydrolase [Thaumarchaeota archaeon]|nr:HAD family hydrolase [Nitrososphaerota archaeon]
MGIRAVFFDLGGTLLVMRRDRIFRRVLSEQGREASLERIHSAYMNAESWWLSAFGQKVMTPEQTNEAYRELDERTFASLYPNEGTEAVRVSKVVRKRWPELESEIPLELYPDVDPTLTKLAKDGYFLGLISNAPPDTARVVQVLGLRKYLSSVIISGDVGYTKPHPEIFRIALREAGVDPADALHVGDFYEADIIGARNAGIKGLLIDREGSHSGLDCPRMKSLGEVYHYLE